MIFTATHIKGAFIIEVKRIEDERGFFGRAFCQKEFESRGLSANMVQTNISYNKVKGTLRGLHMQVAPAEEAKLVRCCRGAIYDVLVDLRPGSETYMQWYGVELTADNYKMLMIPEGCAHGYLTLEDNTDVSYQVSEFYTPHTEVGFLYNDEAFNIEWPFKPVVISQKDLLHRPFAEQKQKLFDLAD